VTLGGGIADKFGNRYEGRWTVVCMAEVMDDAWASITVEPPDGEKIEFSGIRADGIAEHHQAKRRAPDDSWSLVSLERAGLLEAVVNWTEPGHEFHLVTSSPVGGGLVALTDHARLAETPENFTAGLGQEAAAQFASVRQRLPGVAVDRLWQALARTRFRQVDEETVKRLADAQLRFLVDGDPLTVRLMLADFAIEEARHTLTAGQLWRYAAAHSVGRRDLGRDPGVRAAVDRRRSRFVEELATATIAGQRFQRQAASQVVDQVRAGTHRIVLLSAPAGMGKSVALREAVDQLATIALVLPFRLDHVVPNVEADAIGRALGLPGSPATVLAHLAGHDRAILVIDQLDAVSQASGRNPDALRAVEEMLNDCVERPNVTVILACRSFDLGADPRLRRLRDRDDAATVDLGPLSDEEINDVLRRIGIEVDGLSKAQRAVVRVPLHLRLLAEAPGGRGFRNELDLFEAYWAAKRDAVRTRGGSDQAAVDAVNSIASEMSERQTHSVPAHLVDHWRYEVAMLRSEHVLVGDETHLGFFHEAFFDFAFARSFVATGQPLVPFLLSTDQGLFRRSQVRQILAYERAADHAIYVRDLRQTLTSPDIRFHLKALIIDWLATVHEASADEWMVVRDLILGSNEPLAAHAVNLVPRSTSIFDRADDAGDLGGWLAADEGLERERALWILAQAQRRRPRRVAELLRPVECADERGRQGLAFVMRMADLTLDEVFFECFLDAVRRGCLDDLTTPFAVNGSFWDLAHALVGGRPAWAARFVAEFVTRRMSISSSGTGDPFDSVPDPLERDLFAKVARGAPLEYLRAVLPIVLAVIRNAGRPDTDGRISDPVWPFRFYGKAHDVRFGLIEGLEVALAATASEQPDAFAPVRDELVAARSRTADDLLVHAYTAAEGTFAAEAAVWILANPHRIEVGYVDSSYWRGRELVAAVWPHVDANARAALEAMLLNLYPEWERSVGGHRSHGHAQFTILDGLPADELSGIGRRRLEELRRKFGQAHGPRGVVVGRVGSPVPTEKVRHLTDEQWLRAMRTYTADGSRHDRPFGRGGGVYELAGQLHDATREDPARFVQLGLELPDDVHPAYPEAILRGIADAETVSSQDVFAFVRRCHDLPGRPCGRWIADPIARHADPVLVPDDVVDLVAWYATSDPDPSDASNPFTEHGHGPRMRLLNAGINTNRGRIAGAIARLLWRGCPLDPWRSTVLALVTDPADAVRACAAETLLAALRIDREWVATAASQLVAGREEVASSAHAERLLWFLTLTHPETSLPIIVRLVDSDDADVAQVGGRLAALAGLAAPDAAHVVDRALAGSPGARLGVAQVYAEQMGDESARPVCRQGLFKLFGDEEEGVRREAATAFRHLHDDALALEQELVQAFVESPALGEHPDDLLAAFLDSSVVLPDVSVQACLRIIDIAGTEAGAISSAWSAKMPDVASVAVRVHAYGTPEARNGALAVIDRLAEVSAYGLDRAIGQLER
jgi:hypothetical protein